MYLINAHVIDLRTLKVLEPSPICICRHTYYEFTKAASAKI